MKFIFLMFSLLQVMFSSLHKSHQNQSVQFLRYENPSDSLNIQSENQIQSVPRFISNTQTIAAMKKRRNASINNPNKLKLPNKNSIYDPSKLRINENSLENINDNDNYNLISSKKNSVESRENIEIISNKKNKESQEGNPCKCDNSIICPSCIKSLNFKNSNCYCAQPPELKCPSCNVGKAVRQIHEEAQKEVRSCN